MATVTDLGSGVNTANPSTTCSMTTTAALADQESVFVSFRISNDNPTFGSAPTFAGHNMVEVLRMAKTGTGTVVLFGYKNATGSSIASGATVTGTWTNTGTTNGGGSEMNAGKCDSVVDPTTAAATGTAQNTSATPSATTGAPPSSTKDYLSVSGLGGLLSIPATGLATPPAGYTAFSEGFNSTRLKSMYAAGKVLTQPVSAETVAWTESWANPGTASKQWAEVVALFELAASGATYTKTGSVVAGTVTSGADVFTSSETGALVAGTTFSAADAHTATRTGSVVAGGVLSGADARTAVETGSLTAGGLLAGAQAQPSQKTGSLTTNTLTAGADVHTAVRLGALTATATLAGVGVVGAPVVAVTDRFGPPSPEAAEFAGAPGANRFKPPNPRRA
jgi:hypothetical protein